MKLPLIARSALLAFALSATALTQAHAQTQYAPELLAQAPQGKPWEAAWGFWPKATPEAWQQTHGGFVSQAKKGGFDVVFLGDSITKGWAGAGKEIWARNYQPLKAINIGIGGDTTRQTLWRIDHEAFADLKPKVVVLMIGVNNIFTANGNDEEIAKGVQEILKQIHTRLPATKVLLLSILPLGNQGQSTRASKINHLLAGFQSPTVQFLDLTPAFIGDDGRAVPALYNSDLVHLSPAGYEAFDKKLQPALLKLLK